MINIEKTGKNINRIRQDNTLSMRDLQSLVGLETLNAVYNWTSGKRLPSIDNLVILADILGCHIDDILVVD